MIAVNPRSTSQTCHCCLHIGIRSGKSFKCSNKTCGWIGDADANGSQILDFSGAGVIQPREPNLLACPISLGLQKAPVKLTF